LARRQVSMDALLEQAPSPSGLFKDHLQGYQLRLQRQGELLQAWRQVLGSPGPVRIDSIQAYKLQGMGLVCREGDLVLPRYPLYGLYFRELL